MLFSPVEQKYVISNYFININPSEKSPNLSLWDESHGKTI